jgi:Na+:H+ antiporter, NhaA family
MRKRIGPLKKFMERESSSGVIILIAAAMGLMIANSPLHAGYQNVLDFDISIDKGLLVLHLTILKIINYILMTFFFFVVGLEIKREMTSGHLANFKDAITPIVAAIGGMAIPAVIYLAIAGRSDPGGWGVPVATDIALAVGLLTILGKSVAPSLRSFLLGLAVIDDIGAILIIAFIYSNGIGLGWTAGALLLVFLVELLKRFKIRLVAVYAALGIVLWYFLYRSGMHPTIAGVILGLLAPNAPKDMNQTGSDNSSGATIIEWLEERIHPWSTFVIVPLFAFANTGVEISLESLSSALSSPVAWGVFFGLVIGKPLGVVLSVYGASRTKLGALPKGSTFPGIVGTGGAAGIGFTVAIFIAHLAFEDRHNQETAIIAIIAASIISGLISTAFFKYGVKDKFKS